MVTLGETGVEPFTLMTPMPSMLAELVFVVFQERVEISPSEIDAGIAEILTVGSSFTITVTLELREP